MGGRTLFSGGTILTMTGKPADAVLVEDGRILAAGDAAALGDMAGAGAARVDLAGATLMPGLI
ncbi:MAG: amidohydrolase, partial [Parvibaculum sp.]